MNTKIIKSVNDVNDEHVHRTYATFLLRAKDLDPDHVTHVVGTLPTFAHKRGEPRSRSRTWRQGFWEICTKDNIASKNLVVHIEWLLSQLEGSSQQLLEVIKEYQSDAEIRCYWESEAGYGGLDFSSQLIKRIASLNLDLLISIYSNE